MNRADKLTILIVDDQEEVLDIYRQFLGDELGHDVECVWWAGEALRHAANRLFDIALIDAKIPYKGAALGGLILADEIGSVLGTDSVVLMSQYDVQSEVGYFNPQYTFLPKPKGSQGLLDWVEKDLFRKVRLLVARQYGFVVMPFGDKATDVWYEQELVPSMKEAGFQVRRMDEMPTPRTVNTELQKRIKEAHFVVVHASGAQPNANVYFEGGYAAALNKYLILCSPEPEELPFDVASYYVLRVGQTDKAKQRATLLKYMTRLRAGGVNG